MYQIDNATSAVSPPAVPAAGAAGYFTNGVPSVTAPTTVEDWWLNMIQAELVNVATMDGASLDKADNTQCATVLEPILALKSGGINTGSGVTTTYKTALLACNTSQAATSSGTAAAIASSDVAALGTSTAIAGSSGSGGGVVTAQGLRCFVAACYSHSLGAEVTCEADTSVILASEGAITASSGGSRQMIAACDDGPSGTVTVGDNVAVIASEESKTQGAGSKNCAVIASQASDAGTGGGAQNCIVLASDFAGALGDSSAVIASENTAIASGNMSLVAASYDSAATANRSAAIASLDSRASAPGSMVLGSRFAEVGSSNYIGGGASSNNITFNGSDQNLEWKVDLVYGQIYSDQGSITTPADYAEAFENASPGEIPVGSLVMRSGLRVAPAVKGAPGSVLGVVSATPAMVGNASAMAWTGRYMRDEWGRRINYTAHFVRWKGRNAYHGLVSECPLDRDDWPEGAEEYAMDLPKRNPDYDSTRPYTDRTKRPDEWTVVGLLGQLRVRVTEQVVPDDWIGPGAVPGVADKASAKDSRIQVMDMVQPFDADRGYGIALALVR